MPGYLRAVTAIMTGGAIVGAGTLAMLPPVPQDLPPLFATAQVPDPPSVPCKQQFWLNSDRACQTWTVPHREIKSVLSAKTDAIGTSAPTAPTEIAQTIESIPAKVADRPTPAPPSVAGPPMPIVDRDEVTARIAPQRDEPSYECTAEAAATDARLVGGETVAQARARASRAPNDKTKVARRDADVSRNIPIASRSADGTRRVIMIRPTSQQDVLYYSARRELAAASSPAAGH